MCAVQFDIGGLNTWTVPHPPSEPPTASTPRTPRLSRTHAYANDAPSQSHGATMQTYPYAASQSQSSDVNNSSVIGQKQRAGKEVEGRHSTGKNTSSSMKSNTDNSTRSNTSSNMARMSNRSNVALGTRPAVQHDKSATYKDSARSETVTHDDDGEVLTTTSHETTRRRQSERRGSNTSSVSSTRQKGKVTFGKIPRCFLTDLLATIVSFCEC